jgi:hypothetical protein
MIKIYSFNLLLIYFSCNISGEQDADIYQLVSTHASVDSIITRVYNYYDQDFRPGEEVFVINIVELDQGSELRISAIKKSTFHYHNSNEYNRMIGIYSFMGIEVLVFSDEESPFFKRTKNKIAYNKSDIYYNSDAKPATSKPDHIYEPIVWIYKHDIDKNLLVEIKHGYYVLFN